MSTNTKLNCASSRCCNSSPQHRCCVEMPQRCGSAASPNIAPVSATSTSTFSFYCLCTMKNKTHTFCWEQRLVMCSFCFLVKDSSTIMHSFPVWRAEPPSSLLASDVGSSRGTVIIILTVPEPAGVPVDTKHRAAPGVWAKLKKMHVEEEETISHVPTAHAWALCVTTKYTVGETGLNRINKSISLELLKESSVKVKALQEC